jgi:hypothetical protein
MEEGRIDENFYKKYVAPPAAYEAIVETSFQTQQLSTI